MLELGSLELSNHGRGNRGAEDCSVELGRATPNCQDCEPGLWQRTLASVSAWAPGMVQILRPSSHYSRVDLSCPSGTNCVAGADRNLVTNSHYGMAVTVRV